MAGGVDFIDATNLLPWQPWERNKKLFRRWNNFSATYGNAWTRAVAIGATLIEFGYNYPELLPNNILAEGDVTGQYTFIFGDGDFPIDALEDEQIVDEWEHFGSDPDASPTETIGNWTFWRENTGTMRGNERVYFYGIARLICRMFQLEVARELLIIFGITNVTKGGES